MRGQRGARLRRRAAAWTSVLAVTVVTAAARPAAASGGTRVVARGETLSGVAKSLGVSVADLAQANDISDIHRVQAGRRLVVPSPNGPAAPAPAPAPPPPATRLVAKGETLSSVAKSLGVSVASLAQANNIANVHQVRAGRRLVVPAPATAAAGVPATLAASSASLPQRLRQAPDRLALLPHFDAAAAEFGVPADLFKAMTWLESGWQNDRVSSTKAYGIGQLMPDTVAFVNGVLLKAELDPRRPEDNIRMSARFLAYLLRQHGGDVRLALASYYQGLASVRRQGPLPQTQRYVANVLALRQKF